jgi:hypothetical protein
MSDQRAVARKIASFATPTEAEIAYFEALPADEQRALLKAEIEKGFVGDLSSRSVDEIMADARMRAESRRRSND